jgi:hypothetical protein
MYTSSEPGRPGRHVLYVWQSGADYQHQRLNGQQSRNMHRGYGVTPHCDKIHMVSHTEYRHWCTAARAKCTRVRSVPWRQRQTEGRVHQSLRLRPWFGSSRTAASICSIPVISVHMTRCNLTYCASQVMCTYILRVAGGRATYKTPYRASGKRSRPLDIGPFAVQAGQIMGTSTALPKPKLPRCRQQRASAPLPSAGQG